MRLVGGGGRELVWCSVCVMKIMSSNVRGLGGFEKRGEVCKLVREKQPFILCIQKTKLPMFDALVCRLIWGDDNVELSYQPLIGASGGLMFTPLVRLSVRRLSGLIFLTG